MKVLFKRVFNLLLSTNSKSDCGLLMHILTVSQDYQIQFGETKAVLEKHTDLQSFFIMTSKIYFLSNFIKN